MVDLTQLQRQIVDRAQSQVAEQAGKTPATDPGQGADKFERLMEAQDHAAAEAPGGANVPPRQFEQPLRADATGAPTSSGAPTSVGDRILANMSGGPEHTPAASAPAGVDAMRARPGIDVGDPMDSLDVQMRVAELKAETGLATAAVQKTTQAADTLLKSQ